MATDRDSRPALAGPVLVLGGTGTTGRRVADRLSARGVPVRVGSRAATPPFDWNQPATWRAAVRGTRAIYLTYAPDVAVPGAAATVEAFVAAAVAEEVERLVLLSRRGAEEARRTETAVQRSGVEWTVLRASWLAQNFSESYLLDGLLTGSVALPVDAVREPFVDADDVADLAVAALTEERHHGQVYELTGPDLLTFADAVAEIATATGRELRFQPVPVSIWLAELACREVPAGTAALLRRLFAELLDGRNAHLADGVERGLGRPPRSFREYARTAAATGVWDPR